MKDKVFVVTGGGNGLGRELVLKLLQSGAKVAAVDISEEGLQKTASLAGDLAQNLSSHVVNITRKAEIEALVQAVRSTHDQVDGIINNAGIIQPFVRVEELDMETIERVMHVNFYGAVYMVRAFLPELKQRDKSFIVNVSSMGGFFPVPGQTIYGASKAALKLFTEGLNSELQGTNVQVTLVLPGGMGTDIVKNSGQKMSSKMENMQAGAKILSPQRAAEIIVNGVSRGRNRILVGNDARIMNILYRMLPGIAPRLFAKFMGDKLLDS